MFILQIIILAIIQGLAELLPVSSSAHVVVAEKLMGLDPTSPPMTFLLVMLHTGTMLAVIAYFWKAWKRAYFSSAAVFRKQAPNLILATLLTGVIGFGLIKAIEITIGHAHTTSTTTLAGGSVTVTALTTKMPHADVESLFGNLALISIALFAAGVLIFIAGFSPRSRANREIALRDSAIIGVVQALCLPFRGFSRSGATISAGLLLGCAKPRVEEFSFALAVLITPAAIGREVLRLIKPTDPPATQPLHIAPLLTPGLLGLAFSFLAGLVAQKNHSRVLEKCHRAIFGVYCIAAAIAIFTLYLFGF